MPRVARIALAAAVLAASLAGCVLETPSEASGLRPRFPPPPAPPTVASASEEARDDGALRTQWPESVAPRYAAYLEAMRAEGGAEDWIAALDAHLAMPEDVRIVHTECGIQNAYYSPDDKAVFLCWELLDLIASVMQDPSVPPEDVEYAIGSAWLFVVFHELGHALVDVYDLPITGREEDAVDDLATITLIDAGASDAAVAAAVFWILTDDGQYGDAKFADEHSLNAQRFYGILCTVYGSDPERYADLVDGGYLPYGRAQRCPREYAQKDASWSRLLEPWTLG